MYIYIYIEREREWGEKERKKRERSTTTTTTNNNNNNNNNKGEKELETLIQSIRIYSQDIRMKFDIEEYSMLMMENGKISLKGIELPNEWIRILGDMGNYKYFGILEAVSFKQLEMNEKIKNASHKNEKTSRNQTVTEISSKR